ncbi:hypothetical protein NECAME_10910 [Necator americanus]|uniref:Uncharacterized protein n=1 Tax=Necator americanus TaxID=51031 RepID=W2T9E2_NECAM|nr:hypothetical protein NECAME_10910 [Necator americanus]ETN77607.1 hypothetical protein NECAME_10910 [Necator americanus]
MMRTYEYNRRWWPLALTQPFAVALAGTGASLSARYQITENIRTIRVVLPAVLFDALVSVVDVCGTTLFKPEKKFQKF